MRSLTVAIVGNGGREHALMWAVDKSPLVKHTIRGEYGNLENTLKILTAHKPDLVIVGPEVPLVAGLIDQLEAAGITAFGPSAAAAMLEGSKGFTKKLCLANGIPTAPGIVVKNYDAAAYLITDWDNLPVVKADGLCGGKGVVVPDTMRKALSAARAMFNGEAPYGKAGVEQIVIEDRLYGNECSMMFLCQDKTAIPLPPARDYKRALDGDKGLNTGGMGAYSPLPDVDSALVEEVRLRIILPILQAMKDSGTPFHGLLYAGLMLTDEGPKLLEFNVRFGDPETQVVLPRLESDIVPYLLAIAKNEPGALARLGPLAVKDEAAVCVTLACEGYPENPKTGKLIRDEGDLEHTHLFRAGMRLGEDGQWYTSGGRVASAVGLSRWIGVARERAYVRAGLVSYTHKCLRRDIAADL